MEITSASPLEDTGSLEVTSGAGPSIEVENVQQEIERTFGPADWHHESNCTPVVSTLPETCTGTVEKADALLP